jgi:hypothetical protein
MDNYNSQLIKSANEIRQFIEDRPDLFEDKNKYYSLAEKIEKTAKIVDLSLSEVEIEAIHCQIIDSFPITVVISPTFNSLIDAIQRKRKRKAAHF